MNAWRTLQVAAVVAALALLPASVLGDQGKKKKPQENRSSEKASAQPQAESDEPESDNPRVESLRIEPWPWPRPHPMPPPERFSVNVETDRGTYYIGDSVRISFSASDDAYVYIFNTDAAGVTRQLFPNYYDKDSFVHGERRYSIPRGGYSLVATGPPGSESLRIVAYRQRWRVLDSWNRFRDSEPFPERPVSPDQMRSQIQREAGAKAEGERPSGERAPEALGIRPVPYPPSVDHAEDWARFRTLPRRGYYPYEPEPLPYPYPSQPPSVRRHPGPEAPVPRGAGAIRISTSPSDCDVFINGIYAGKSPDRFPAPEGQCEVVIAHGGYVTERTEVAVRPGQTPSLSIRLRPEE